MTSIEVIESQPWHCGRMARLLRHEHQKRLGYCQLDVHRELRKSFDESSWRRSALIDGSLVAMGGVVGPDIAAVGYIWMAMSQEGLSRPIAMTRTIRSLLEEVMTLKRELACVVIPDDEAALRLAVFLGFHSDAFGPGSAASTRERRRDLVRFLSINTELRMSFGNGWCIPLGIRRESGLVPLQ